jgi:hypothetical protein
MPSPPHVRAAEHTSLTAVVCVCLWHRPDRRPTWPASMRHTRTTSRRRPCGATRVRASPSPQSPSSQNSECLHAPPGRRVAAQQPAAAHAPDAVGAAGHRDSVSASLCGALFLSPISRVRVCGTGGGGGGRGQMQRCQRFKAAPVVGTERVCVRVCVCACLCACVSAQGGGWGPARLPLLGQCGSAAGRAHAEAVRGTLSQPARARALAGMPAQLSLSPLVWMGGAGVVMLPRSKPSEAARPLTAIHARVCPIVHRRFSGCRASCRTRRRASKSPGAQKCTAPARWHACPRTLATTALLASLGQR